MFLLFMKTQLNITLNAITAINPPDSIWLNNIPS